MSHATGDIFLEEAAELLVELEASLLALEKTPDDRLRVGEIFRTLHTLKGSGGMFGCEEIAGLAHELEAVFERVRDGRLSVDRPLVELALEGLDLLREQVAALQDEAPETVDTAALVARLQNLVSGASRLAPPETAATPDADSAPGGLRTYRIRFRPPPDIFQRGLSPVGFLQEIDQLGECVAVAQTGDIPDLGEIDPQSCYLFWDLILTTPADLDTIRDVFIFIEDGCSLSITLIDEEGWPDNPEEYKKLGEILTERGDLTPAALDHVLRERKRIGETLVEAGLVDHGQVDSALAEQQRVKNLRRQRLQQGTKSSQRVSSEKLDALVDLVGELVTVQARLSQLAGGREDPALTGISEEVERLTWDMRDQILNIRMVPIGSTFSKYQRLVRDLSRDLGKDVDLVATGADTELDKAVIEKLGDPLVHLLRNAIDHGIETSEERRAAGKPLRGEITLRASHSGAAVVIELRDDGRGLDREAIVRRAVSLGLWPEGAEATERDLFGLIAAGGLSTAKQVTNVSGRGVGMDAVRQAIESLRGSIEVGSRPGEGTVFTLRLPLTLAIIDGLLVEIGDDHFVLPMSQVEECIELSRAEAASRRRVVRVRGEPVPYIRLRERFEVEGDPPVIEQIVIGDIEGQRAGFVVDRVVGEHQTVIKPLGRLYRQIRGLSGATILGDGRVALILDPQQLFQMAEADERLATESTA